ncbi:uncharacterized protein LOC131152195 [Malania oleifera]|uniref:uncharacterized protein LOC131152195 n=1 Tax=Malania oleifera TaxID=397392 RepID=UPI0025ADD06E|nr:uncharacterized protein LOC131152195 [Malania oleifera]
MADDLDPDTCVGFKRRIREVVSGTEDKPDTLQQQDRRSLTVQSQNVTENPKSRDEGKLADIVCVASDSGTFFQKKVRCCENMQEPGDCEAGFLSETEAKQGNGEVGMLGFGITLTQECEKNGEEVSFCVLGDTETRSPAKDEVWLSGVQEFGCLKNGFGEKGSMLEVQMGSVVEDCQAGLGTPSPAFKQSQEMLKDCFLKMKEKGHSVESEIGSVSEVEAACVIKVADSESSVGIMGGSFKNKDYTQNMSKIEGKQKMAPRQCCLNIEVIDETALIQSPSVSKDMESVDCAKNSEINGKKNVNSEIDAKKEKKTRRRGKGAKKVLGTNGKQNIVSHSVESQNVCQKAGGGTLRIYSRKQMEALRFVNCEGQKKMWNDVYCMLGPVVAGEYNDLASCNHQKHIRVNFDPRQHFGKKEEPPAFLGEVCSQDLVNEMEGMKDNGIENVNSLEAYHVNGEDSCTVLEGECSEDSDEYYSSIQRPAFYVAGEPNFDSGPPEDGLEYLRRVRWEAAQIPKVKVAKLEKSKLDSEQTVYMPMIPDIAKCPDHLLPMKKWEDAFLADFSELRLAVSGLEGSNIENFDELQSIFNFHECRPLPESATVENFDKPTVGVDSFESPDSSSIKHPDVQQSVSTATEYAASVSSGVPSTPKSLANEFSINDPTLSVIQGMDSVARASMLRRRISSAEHMSTLSRSDCLWLFALCAAVDTPLDADTCAALRSLLRKCAILRAAKSEVDDEVVMLNILVTISGCSCGLLTSAFP